jgi:nitrite reductase/ring-hydroxylating ferredoxin subunit/DMSO/TMAO reductase YedYZ heme-binding membrane subunit
MSVQYSAVLWNRQKKIYDATVAGGVLLYMALFVGLGSVVHPNATAETLWIRGLGTAAFLLLHVILAIGPLTRLDKRFLPLLYNRRHLGVMMFFLALAHGVFAIIQFHALGNVSPLVSLFASFPSFQLLGFAALIILFAMASTSHDVWLHWLTPGVWKRIHMLVYAAYALLVAHVAFGALQSETSPVLVGVVGAGVLMLSVLHAAAAQRENARDATLSGDFVPVCDANGIPDGRAVTVCANGEKIAVFRHGANISAVSNVCRHQNGPLGEGRIVDGCITCPWHGYQYDPVTGRAPAPFEDQIPTFPVRISKGMVYVGTKANAS